MVNTKVELHIVSDAPDLSGVITLELDNEKAPVSVENFVKYVRKGFYNGLIFHRVIPGFMIQGGGFTSDMSQKRADDPIVNEAANGLKNSKYTIAMARTRDPMSAATQFFINVADNKFLDHTGMTTSGWGYAVFGSVISGQDVVDRIMNVKTKRYALYDDVPVTAVVIQKAEVVESTENDPA